MATSRAISQTPPLPLRVFLPPSLNMFFSFIPVQGDNVISVSIFGFPVIAPDIFSFFVVVEKKYGKSQIFQPFYNLYFTESYC